MISIARYKPRGLQGTPIGTTLFVRSYMHMKCIIKRFTYQTSSEERKEIPTISSSFLLHRLDTIIRNEVEGIMRTAGQFGRPTEKCTLIQPPPMGLRVEGNHKSGWLIVDSTFSSVVIAILVNPLRVTGIWRSIVTQTDMCSWTRPAQAR